MRTTILPCAIILTAALWPLVSLMAEGCIVNTASEAFRIYTTQLNQFLIVFFICTI